MVRLHLRAIAPVWVRVTADGKRVFQGILGRRMLHRHWKAHRTIYVVTYDGAHVKATYDGHGVGRMAAKPGLVIYDATSAGWRRVA